LILHPVGSVILEITLQNGRKVEITPYHSLFTLREGEVVPVKGDELSIGSYVVVPKCFPEPTAYKKELDLLEEYRALSPDKTRSINLYGVNGILKDNTIKLLIKNYILATHTPQFWGNVYNDFVRYNYLPFNAWRVLPREHQGRFAGCRIGNKRNNEFSLPSRLPISQDLIELLGLYAAEGSSFTGRTNRVVWSFGAHERQLITHTQTLICRVFGYDAAPHYAHASATTIQIDSLAVAVLFRDILGAGGSSHEKKIPQLIFNVAPFLRERYLIAYAAGDGHPSPRFTAHLIDGTSFSAEERNKFTLASASRELVDDLSYLLFSLGKTFSLGTATAKSGREIAVVYKGARKVAKLPATLSWRLEFYWNTNSSYVNRVPVQETIEHISWVRPYSFSVSTRGGITLEKIDTLVDSARITLFPATPRFLSSDLGVLKVTNIRTIPYSHPWVYDFSVPGGENFVGGSAPIMVHNSLDEAMAGFAKNISVTLLANGGVGGVRVVDDGRGIPVDVHKQTKKSALETVMTTLHAGGKFGGDSYKVSGGLHGVGVSVVNALSKQLIAEVCRDGRRWRQEYERGVPTTKVKETGKCQGSGTTITFIPDSEIFKDKDIRFDWNTVLNHLRQQAYLTAGVNIKIRDEREKEEYLHKSYAFCFESGIRSYVEYLNRGQKAKHESIFYVAKEVNEIQVEVALQYIDDLGTREEAFANNIYNPEGGAHITGFRTALTRVLNDYARKNSYLKDKDNLTGEDVREGLTAVISLKLREPQFEGQTKAKLGTPEARGAVEGVFGEAFGAFLEESPQEARAILGKVILALEARKAAKAAKETVLRRGALEGLTLPGKLADCQSRKAEDSELFLVEGDSAGGSAKMGRDRRTQAILPLRGKILNVERAR
ncbi:MAG: ATP-binding protein, partial [Patescibacteria group bacterium]